MSKTVQLPPSLAQRLDRLARRVLLVRALGGFGLLVLALAVVGGVALLADYASGMMLPAAIRGLALAGWLAMGVGIGVVLLLLPLLRRLDPADLAAVIEQKYPELGERLTTSVELCQNSDLGNGSPELIAILVRETEARSRRLDFLAAISERTAWLLAAVAAGVALAAVAPAAVFPQQYLLLSQRFLLPWARPVSQPDYQFAVRPGDVFAARGRTLTIAAELTPRHDHIELPRAATLVVTEADGSQTRHDLHPNAKQPAHFSGSVRVKGDFTYRVEAGNAASDPHRVTAVTPVELAANSPGVVVTPPTYARSSLDTETMTGLADLSALAHSEVAFAFQFTRPAVSARLEWTPEAAKGEKAKAVAHAITLAEDGKSGKVVLSVPQTGVYRLVLAAEHAVLTELEGGTITARPDQPPSVLRFAGKEDLRAVRAHDRVPVEVRLADDIGVAGAELLWKVDGQEKTHEETIRLDGAGTREALAKHQFLLAGKVKEGDEVRYRVRYRDNRPKAYGGAQVRYYPEERWLALKVVKQAGSLKEQEIQAQRDAIARKLEQIKADLRQERRATDKVRAESRGQETLAEDHAEQVRQLRRQNQGNQKALRDLAAEADETGALEKLADKARDVAGQELARADTALRETTSRELAADRREKQFRDADRELEQALNKLDELGKLNDRLAKDRLDQAKVEALADRQRELAEKAADLAARHQAHDPEAKKLAEQLRREQEQVEQELRRLTENSEALQKALEEARAEQARQAAEQARQLADAQRELADASDRTEKRRAAERLAELAERQKELAEKAAGLGKDTWQAAKSTSRGQPFKAEDAARAVLSLMRGDSDKALKELDRAARELERLAGDLDKAANLAKDPRDAARQLAKREDDLARRTRLEGARQPAEKPAAERLEPMRREQEAIRRSAEELSVPPDRTDAQKERARVLAKLAAAEKALQQGKAPEAAAQMEKARDALRALADRLPSARERQKQAQAELEKVRREQDAIARLAEEKRAEAAERQAALARRLQKLDTPNQEDRRDRAKRAMDEAVKNLRNKDAEDPAAAQKAAQRELERLAQALAGQTPADERAAELAKRQDDLARRAERAAADRTTPREKLDELARQQRQLAEEARGLDAKEAPASKRQAADAARQAADAAKANPAGKEARDAMRESAKKLDKLARAMKGDDPARAKQEPGALPSREQVEQARQLAREQREVQEAVRRATEQAKGERRADATPNRENAAGKLAQAQQQLAREAAELSKQVGREQGGKSPSAQQAQQAARAADQAARDAQAGALEQARDSGEKAAGQMQQLAKQLSQTPRGEAQPGSRDPLQQARELAKRQEELNKQLQPMTGNTPAERAQQQARQAELARQTDELGRRLEQMGSTPGRSPQAQNSARDAASQARQAQQQMKQAQSQSQQGKQSEAQQSRQQAARSLDKAAQQAQQAGKQSAAATGQQPGKQGEPGQGEQPTPSAQAGRSVQDAQGQMEQARGQMQKGQPNSAQRSMQNAAQQLHSAAQQMQRSMQPGEPTPEGDTGGRLNPGGKTPDGKSLPGELAALAGKRWGELSGELRTKIVQEMRAKYGEDYARMIKLYFEQIADTRRPAKAARGSRP